LKKLEYDFVCYLVESNLYTEKSMVEYDKKDMERLEILKRAEEEEKERLAELERQEEVERQHIMDIIAKESLHISDVEKSIADSIYSSLYGSIYSSLYGRAENLSYSLIALIHNFDNKYCKEEIISRLHNGNKASIKIFECITGLKLPKAYKDRIGYIESITSADFQNMKEYKPRKKTERKEVKREEFFILTSDYKWVSVIAEPVKKYDIDMFYIDNGTNINISHAETGICLARGKNKTECLKNLKNLVDQLGKENFYIKLKNTIKIVSENAGINPRYENRGVQENV